MSFFTTIPEKSKISQTDVLKFPMNILMEATALSYQFRRNFIHRKYETIHQSPRKYPKTRQRRVPFHRLNQVDLRTSRRSTAPDLPVKWQPVAKISGTHQSSLEFPSKPGDIENWKTRCEAQNVEKRVPFANSKFGPRVSDFSTDDDEFFVVWCHRTSCFVEVARTLRYIWFCGGKMEV